MTLKRFLLAIASLLLISGGHVVGQTAELVDQFTLGPKNPAAPPTLADDGLLYGTTLNGGAYGFGTIYRVLADGQFEIVGNFTGPSGALPGATASSSLTRASDGNLYGVTEAGGPEGVGTVFKVVPGKGAVSLASFTGFTGALPGFQPIRSLAVGADGQLYGTTRKGGSFQAGTVFKVTLASGAVTNLATFTGGTGALPGYYPGTTLALGGDGYLYGAADTSDGLGMIFKVSTTGAASKVANFTGSSGLLQGIGRFTGSQLTPDGRGNLYGISESGGPAGLGTIFKIVSGGGAKSIASFTGTSGALPGSSPYSGTYLTLANDGFLYGTTQQGGTANSGVIFRVSPSDVAETVASFTGSAGTLPGATPRAPVTKGSDGNLYGTVRDGLGAGRIYCLVPGGQVTIIGVFTGTGGVLPGNTLETPLVPGPKGNLFGITQFGGGTNTGTLFQIAPDSGPSTVGTFLDAKGSAPRSAFTAAVDGMLYGTAPEGGATGSGLIFKLKPGFGGIQPIASFTGELGQLPGTKPWNKLRATPNGTLYGTTLTGGSSKSGSVFEVVPNGPVEVLTNFGSASELSPASDGRLFGSTSAGTFFSVLTNGRTATSTATVGRAPGAALQQAGDGKFYGITPDGGTGFGTVFVFDPANNTTVTLGGFTGQTGALLGRIPRSKLTLAPDGSLYGSTTAGGTGNAGTIFKVTPGGSVVSIASFTGDSGALPGRNPSAALVVAADGKLYGVTSQGGAQNIGTVFRVLPGPSPVVESLVSFTGTGGTLPGNAPLADLLAGPDGLLYGTTSAGGADNSGTVFQVIPGGAVTRIASFTGRTGALAGALPLAPLTVAADGNLYGTTSSSGEGGGGTVYRIVLGPTVFTKNVTDISFTKATFSADVNPNRDDSEAWFEYGTTPTFGLSSTPQLIPAGSEPVLASRQISQLAPDTGYYFRVVARNRVGTQRGETLSFTTKAAFAAQAETIGSADVGARRVTLVGKATANGLESFAYFEFGPSAGSGASTLARILSPEDVGGEYRVEVGGLEAHTKYFFRAVATNPIGRGFGEEGSFTTANTNPVGSTKVLHAPEAGVETVVYGVGDTADADGDERVLSVGSYTGAGSVTSTEREIRYTGAGFVGSESLEVLVSDGFGGSAVATVTLRNEAPHAGADRFSVGAGESWLEVLGNDGDADGDTLSITAVSEAGAGTVTSDGQRLSYTPGAGFRGVDVFSYTISDGRGGSASAQVTVMADYSVPGSVAVNKESVPGVSGGRWTRFGAPSLFAGGTQAGWLAWVNSASGRFQGIFSGGIGEPVLRVRSGDSARAEDGSVLRGVKFSKFEEPVFAGGSIAFMARVNGPGGSELEQTGVWISEQGTLRAIGREGEMAPGTNGAKFRAFNAVAMPGTDAVFFKAKLEIGKGGVSEANATGLWVWSTTGTRLALRQGQAIDFGQGVLRVRSFEVLQAMTSAPGQGGYDATTQRVDALITFSNNSVAIASIGLDASIRVVALTGEPDPAGRLPAKFGTPSSPGYGQLPVAVVTFEAGKAKLTEKNNQAVYDFEQERIIAQEGAEAPGVTGARFLSFENAVAGYGAEGERVTAFVATLGGVQAKANVGLWVQTGTEVPQLKLVAQKGAEPPDAPGTRFQRFESVSVMEGRGTLFKAKLASGTAKVTPSNDEGLWGTDSTGALRLLLRKGQQVAGKNLRSFTLLHEVPRSAAQRRAWTSADPTATLLYLAYFSDGSSAILSTTLP